jgi:hypothetical protein
MRLIVRVTAGAAALIASAVVAAYEKPGFPRLGGYNIGTPQSYDEAEYQERLSRLDMIVLNNFPGWSNGKRMTMQQSIAAMKARNPDLLVFTYLNVNERKPGVTAWMPVIDKLYEEKWWLYTNGIVGSLVPSTWAGNYITNYTLGARANSAGERYVDWYPKWAVKEFISTTPGFDGAFTDNFFWEARVDGDWNRDGVIDKKSTDAARKMHRDGMRRYLDNIKRLMPGKFQIGNIGGWGPAVTVITEYTGQLHGGVLEHYIGETWSPEGLDWEGKLNSYGSWPELMKRYRRVMQNVAEPKLVIFNQLGAPRNYQAMRYGLASCMMDDAYYQLSPAGSTGIYSSVTWFDEYDQDLGQAVTAPPTAAWKSGVYRRDFQNGIALVNPRGNGAVTVELEKEFRRIKGVQAPDVNNGQLTRTVTLKDRDGIILLSTTPTKQPEPPTDVTIE